MCGVTFLTLLTGSSCCVLRGSAYTMGLQLLQLIYGSACVCPDKPSCREGLKPLKKCFLLASVEVALLHGLKCKSYRFAVHHVGSRSLSSDPVQQSQDASHGAGGALREGQHRCCPHPPMGACVV